MEPCYKCNLGEHLDCEDVDCPCCGPDYGRENESYEAHGRSAPPPGCPCAICHPPREDDNEEASEE